jgi:hypothetical protein
MKQRTLAYYTQELKKSQARLDALTGQGTQALSHYDIKIAHQGNAEEALQTAKRLVCNHIAYFTKKIAELKKQPRQLALF